VVFIIPYLFYFTKTSWDTRSTLINEEIDFCKVQGLPHVSNDGEVIKNW
jgi:hypothetical protein